MSPGHSAPDYLSKEPEAQETKDVASATDVQAQIDRSNKTIRESREHIARIDAIIEKCRTMKR